MYTNTRTAQAFRRTVQVCTRLQTQARDNHPDLAGLTRLVQSDAPLADGLLRQVNSTIRGLSHSVRSVEHAIALLGAAGVATFAEQEITRLSRVPVMVRIDEAESHSPTSQRPVAKRARPTDGHRRQPSPAE